MANRPNLIGNVYGRLTVIGHGPKRGARRTWECTCECGSTHFASTSDLNYGTVQSCGCLLRGPTSANSSHSHAARRAPSKTYNSWRGMVERCTNPNHIAFKNYGGRGILVCERWALFDNFLADMGERPAGTSIDRINVDGNYEPSNCRWATNVEQQNNKRVAA